MGCPGARPAGPHTRRASEVAATRVSVAKIREDVVRALRLPDVQKTLGAQAWDTIGNTPAEFAAVIRAEHESWSKVIKAAGIRAD